MLFPREVERSADRDPGVMENLTISYFLKKNNLARLLAAAISFGGDAAWTRSIQNYAGLSNKV
jgi:hypothetical protein